MPAGHALHVLYAAKCYWPGVTEADIDQLTRRASQAGARSNRGEVEYLGTLLFGDDDLVLCLFEGSSRAAVHHASERAGIPCERLMSSVWLNAAPTADRSSPTFRRRT
jgi:hypothetical protein